MKKRLIPLLVVSAVSFGMLTTTLVGCGQVGPQGPAGPSGDKGEPGKDGITPTIKITEDGYWEINGEKTDIKATGSDGADGKTPTIEISPDGYWVINGEKTNTKATGNDGQNGDKGDKGETAWSNTMLPSDRGYVVVDKGSAIVGDTITFKVVANPGYYATGIKLNDTTYNLASDFTYTTTMVEYGYVVSGIFDIVETVNPEEITPENPNISVTDKESLDKTITILDNVDLGTLEAPLEHLNFVGNKGTTIFKGTIDEKGTPTSTIYVNEVTYSGTDLVFENINLVVTSNTKATLDKGFVPANGKAVNSIKLDNVNMDVRKDLRDPFLLMAETIDVANVNITTNGSKLFHAFETFNKDTQIKVAKFSNVNVSSCTQNAISLYNFAPNAEVLIENSKFGSETETISQVLRLSNLNADAKENSGEGAPVKVTVKDVEYHAEKADVYTGFALLQDCQAPFTADYSDFALDFTNVKSYQNEKWTTLAEGNIDYYNLLQSRPYYVYSDGTKTTEVTNANTLPTLTLDTKVINNEDYIKNYADVTISSVEGVTLTSDYDGLLKEGTEVTITATADEFYIIDAIKVNGEVLTNGKFSVGKEKTYTVTVEAHKDVTTFDDIIKNGIAERILTEATVVAKKSGNRGNVLYDGTNFLTTNAYNPEDNYEVGQVLEIIGIPEVYYGYSQFNFSPKGGLNKPTAKILEGKEPHKLGEALPYTNELADAHKDAKEADLNKYVTFEATALEGDKFKLEGGTTDILVKNETFVPGFRYKLTGVLDSYHSTSKGIQFYATNVERLYDAVETLEVSKENVILDKGVSEDITVNITPNSANLEWNYEVLEGGNAFIDVEKTETGLTVIAKEAGTTSITVTTVGNSAESKPLTKTINVTVNAEVAKLEAVTISADKTEIFVGEELTINTATTPENLEGVAYTFTSSNEEVAKFNNPAVGTLTALGAGTTEISVTAVKDGVTVESNKLTFTVPAVTKTTVTKNKFTDVNDSLDDEISYTCGKGGGTSDPAINGDIIRIYQNSAGTGGGYITISSKVSKILSVEIGTDMNTTIAYSTEPTDPLSENIELAKGETIVLDVNASKITIHCMGKTSKTRLYVNYLSVTYLK